MKLRVGAWHWDLRRRRLPVLQFEVVLRLVGIRPARWIRALQGVLILSAC